MAGEDYALRWLQSKGYAPHQAAAIVGHGIQESGLKPNGPAGDNGTAFGMFQWRGPRAAALQQYAASNGLDPQSMDTQLGFLDHEMKTTESRAGNALRASTDVRGASRAMMDYERPAGYTPANPEAGHGWDNRLSNAYRVAGMDAPQGGIADKLPTSGPAIAAGAPMAPPTSASEIAMQFMQQNTADAQQKAQAMKGEAARRQALFTPSAPAGGLSGMFG